MTPSSLAVAGVQIYVLGVACDVNGPLSARHTRSLAQRTVYGSLRSRAKWIWMPGCSNRVGWHLGITLSSTKHRDGGAF